MTRAPIEFAPPRWGAGIALVVWLAGLAIGVVLLTRPGLDASTRLAGLVLTPIAGWCAWVYAGEAWRPTPWARVDAEGLRVCFRRGLPVYTVAWGDVAAVGVREEPFTGAVVAVTLRDPARLPPEAAAFWASAEPDPEGVPEFLLLPKELRTTAETLRATIAGFWAAG